jgi:hypothetical protein
MSILNPWNITLVYIIGAEVIHLFQIKFMPDLLLLDHRSDDLKDKYQIRDIYPFLLIEIFYLFALFYLLFSPFKVLWFYSISLLLLGLIKIYIHRRIKNRFLFIKIDSTIIIFLTIFIFWALNFSK